MLNLNSTIDLDFKTFLRWWSRELRFLVPEKIQQLISDTAGFLIVSFHDNIVLLHYAQEQSIELLASIERGSSANVLPSLYEKYEKLAKAKVVLRLTEGQAIQKELSFPSAVKENLQQVVAYELDKYTPFKEEQVYFAVRLLHADSEYISVQLILTPREILDGLYDDVRALGLSPVLADYENAVNDLEQRDPAYNLLPERHREKTDKTPRLIVAGLLAALLLLLTTALLLPVWFEYQAVAALEEKIAAIEKSAKTVTALQRDIDTLIEENQQLITEKNAAPKVVAMLNELSHLIDNETWLAYLQYSNGHLQMQGESKVASTLIATLEASDLFHNARFVSPVTQDPISKLERFQITTDTAAAKQGANSNDQPTE